MSFDDSNNNEYINEENQEELDNETPSTGSLNAPAWEAEGAKVSPLQGMYKQWFLDYASYVILERAVPHINDGLKPVQRRILHAMNRMEDGRYNKVANIIGFTMQFHPHGDASIGDALVQLGQKNLLIDMQGNWGNILTGDSAAASRYIEARLTKFALDVVFNPKTTIWKQSYDGRNNEPVTLPVKFPLLLAQGVEGIAVGLASKILPHNFNELVDASIAYLKGEAFELYPDFPTGGYVDVNRYNDGLRGGAVKVRAKISKLDSKTLSITEIPFGKTTSSLIETILKANEKGKIKIRKIDDNTAEFVEILVHLPAGASPDKTIDALYAFTECELSISPNSCVISDNKPHFLGVSTVLKANTDHTVHLLTMELEIRLHELNESWHFSSLEKIFIEKKIYLRIEDAETWEEIIQFIDEGLEPYKHLLRRTVTLDDITRLTEIKIKRISKFDAKKADEYIKGLEEEMEKVNHNLANIITYTIDYYKRIKKNYGKDFPRLTEIRSFENIEATKVVIKNEKLYVNYQDGFVGYGLKKDEYVSDCSDIDDIIVFFKDGRYIINKIAEKSFVGKGIIHTAVFRKNDKRTIYNAVYRDGKNGSIYVKRFAVTGITRDRDYDVTQGTAHSEILYFSANANGEAEVLKVMLKPKPRIRNVVFDYDMAELAIKGRASMGNLLTKNEIHKITLKKRGESTLGGRKIWYEPETMRLNADERGTYLGDFQGSDQILTINANGEYMTTGFDLSLHFDKNLIRIEKFDISKTWSAVYFDAEQKQHYIKRFKLDPVGKPTSFISEHPKSTLTLVSDEDHPRVEVTFGGDDKWREKELINVAEFIGEKGLKAKGKRLAAFTIGKVKELEPLIPSVRNTTDNESDADDNQHDGESDGQLSLNL